MAWNNNIPLATHKPSVDQPLMQQNFSQVQTSFSADHVALGTAPDGHHKQMTFDGTATGVILPAGTQSVLYPDVDAVSNNQEMWFSTVSGGVATDVQITNSKLSNLGGAGMLPGGLQIRCGSGNAQGGAGANTNITPNFPTACLSVVVTAKSIPTNRNTLTVTAISTSAFTVASRRDDSSNNGESVNFYYIAIGY